MFNNRRIEKLERNSDFVDKRLMELARKIYMLENETAMSHSNSYPILSKSFTLKEIIIALLAYFEIDFIENTSVNKIKIIKKVKGDEL